MRMQTACVGLWAGVLLVWPAVGAEAGDDTEGAAGARLEQTLERKWQDATVDELVLGLNRLADEISRTQQGLGQRRIELDRAWMDPANSSPEVEALRRRMQELEAEIMATRTRLREAVAGLEAVRAQHEAIERDAEAVERVQTERRVVQRLLQSRLRREQPATP